MRVLHVITGLGMGGAEQQLRLLLRHVPATCDVLTLTNAGSVARGITADGTRVTDLGMAGNRDLAALPRLVQLIRAGRYDVVHTHLYRACLYGRIAARIAGVRAVVATEHSLGDSQMEGRPLTPGVRALYLAGERLGRMTVAVSPAVGTRLHRWGVPWQRIRVVPNGIDVDRFAFDPAARAAARAQLGLPDDAFVIGGVGRLTEGKRFDVLLRAASLLPDDVRVLLVGAGPQERELRLLAARLGIAERVRFAGETGPEEAPRPLVRAAAHLPSLLAAMDALASPSPEEAFGLALMEGLASGLPVLYSSCPAVDALPARARVDSAHCASDPDSFARALNGLHGLHRRGGHLSQHRAVPAAVRHYDITRSADRLMDVYASVLGGPDQEVTPLMRAPSSAPATAPSPSSPSPTSSTSSPSPTSLTSSPASGSSAPSSSPGSTAPPNPSVPTAPTAPTSSASSTATRPGAQASSPDAPAASAGHGGGTAQASPGARLRAELRTRLAPLARLPRWTILPACAALGALAGGTYGLTQAPEYTATSYVVAVPQGRTDPATALGFAQAYGKVATQLAVLGDAQVAARVSPGELRNRVKVATSPDAPMISVAASAARSDDAAVLANAVSRALTTGANHTKDSTQVKLLPFSRAVEPTAPSNLSTAVSTLVGLCAGGLLGGLVLLVRPRGAEVGSGA